MNPHKYDRRGASQEGDWAEALFDEVCKLRKENVKTVSVKEDCEGVDRIINGKKCDIKARKNRLSPNCTWIELAKVAGAIGSGWAYANKWIAQLMVYEESKWITDVKFGLYHTKDLKEVIEKKVDVNSLTKQGELYKLYMRTDDRYKEVHRGIMTVLHYDDLTSLESFLPIDVPKPLWNKVRIQYGYIGVK
jgi:hypothetical protein